MAAIMLHWCRIQNENKGLSSANSFMHIKSIICEMHFSIPYMEAAVIVSQSHIAGAESCETLGLFGAPWSAEKFTCC